jgi:membrane dipeptidase
LKKSAAIAALLITGCAQNAGPPGDGERLHARLLTLDSHLDTPVHFQRADWDFGSRHVYGEDFSQVDIPRMKSGALDGGFFVIFTPQGPLTPQGYADALAFARRRSDLIDAELVRHKHRIEPVLTAVDAERAAARGRLVAFKSMENGYPLGENPGLLAEFRSRGVRLAGPVHSKTNQLADSATDAPRWNGLSPLGREWVAEMNRLGMVIDASHASDAALDEMLALSTTPVLLSHSGSRAVFDHPRNLDDDRIRKLAAAGGAVCVSTVYLSAMNMTDERAALFDKMERIGELPVTEQRAIAAHWVALDRREPMWSATVDMFVRMILHLIEVAGVDHVCMGADWDGGGGIDGLGDITRLPDVTARLRAGGLSDADLARIWSGNLLRVLRAAESHATAER